ncbi:multifunctional 2',3'-cyclic-nucleotide 2'-phosphodiesterase/5'-nucleotidase/3'-nucleotidase [Deinococcus aerophilus]|uniref:Multifunctional 2',3'-cyclic-nucleotide 2'-phosphodiesterase/5'-nucleotidase/3'-nucleotidase n=2 Tax=Deinococcus aerophilus TaxID=522488 RepID=A0ABQ2GLT4_9DEIO|nr:multifunctional 2',3'-cyclic-nucleotide 2'-phosphodiesterase/5'-nucleotidase/3'-nucleotidase [Deinococcus aerophilus]
MMEVMKRNLFLISSVLTLSSCSMTSNPAEPVTVAVVGLNDFHGNLEATNFSGVMIPDPADPTKQIRLKAGGIEAIGGYLAQERAKNPNLVFVGAGDLIGASPITSSLLRDEPSTIALSKLGMKFSSLGNHEFDQGLQELLRMQNGGCDSNDTAKACKFQNPYPAADFQWLGANVVDKTTGKPVFKPYAVQEVGGAKIGFIGAVLQGTPSIVSPDGVKTLDFLDEAASINKYVPELKKMNVDAIIVLIHQGGTAKDDFAQPACGTLDGPIVDIVNKLDPSIRAVITGHSHQGYNCLVGGRVVIQGDYYGHLLQRLDLTVDKANHKLLSIKAANVVVDTRTLPKDPAMTAILTRAKELTDAVKQTPVGTLATPTISRTSNAAGESALGDVIADSQLAATQDKGAVIAFMNPGGIRADLTASAAGNTATFGDIYTVQPFGNTLVVMDLTGAQIKALLEQQFDNPAAGSSRILQVSKGFTYSYDSTAAKGSRVDAASIKLNGQTLDPTKSYRVTMNSFLAGGGDSFLVLKDGTNVLQLPNLVDVDAFVAYAKANPGLAGGPQNRITKTK